MSSWTELVNQALSRLGADGITDIDSDTSENAVQARRVYQHVRDSLLRGHAWRFALKRAELSLLEDEPVFGWQYQFSLPADCLRVVKTEYEHPYAVEGRKLLSNWDEARILYIARVSDATLLDASFSSAYVLALASSLAIPITSSRSMKDLVDTEMQLRMIQARADDAIESHERDLDEAETDRWEEAGR